MKGVIAWWVNNQVAANLLMLGIILAGILGYQQLGREFFPAVRTNIAEIAVFWPGAAPQEVEEQIIIRIEEALTDMDSIDRLNSTAAEGYGSVRVEGLLSVDRIQFMNDIKTRVDSISNFPRDIEPPRVREVVWRDQAMRLAVYGEGYSEIELKRIGERVRDEIAVLPGISVVNVFGVRREEVSIELSEESMRRYGLSFDEVAQAIGGASINRSSGTVRTQTGDIQLRARNMADTKAEFESIIVRQTPEGGIIRVVDVATVIDGFEEDEIFASIDGNPAVLVQVLTTENLDVVDASNSVQTWMDESSGDLPDGIEVVVWWDTADIYKSRMKTISTSAFTGLLLVCIVLVLTLRPKVALWVTFGIATAYAGAFVVLPYLGVSINFISTFAFLMVLGIIVDDAIVVGESIHRVSEDEGGGAKSAVLGTQLVIKPVVFAVLTTMISFTPWLLMTGPDVQIVQQISIIIICALSFSLIEAFFILPAHLHNLKPAKEKLGGFGRLQQRIERGLVSFAEVEYRSMVARVLDHRALTTSIFVAFLVISIGLLSSGWLRFSFLPDIESDEVWVDVELPEGTPYSRALEILAQLQDAEKRLVEEVDAMASAEGNDAQLIEHWYTRARRDSVLAIVKLVPPEERAYTAQESADRLRELVGEIPDADQVIYNASLDNWAPAMQYSISHRDMDVLREAVAAFKDKLNSYDSAHNVRDSLQVSSQELQFQLLPGAAQLGLTLAEVSRQVRQAYYGEEVQQLPRDGNDVRVMVRYPQTTRSSLDSLQNFRVRLADGRQVPLLSVAEIEYQPGISRIDRRERFRSAEVTAELDGQTRNEIHEDLEESFIDDWKQDFPGVTLGAIGEAEGEQQFFQELQSLYLIALFLMYMLIAIAFKSYWHPLLVMTAIPFGLMGAIYGHLVWGVPMGLFSFFGIGAAVGVVVNDNLVLLDAMNRNREAGMNIRDAILEATVTRFRPILLTSVTTFVGLLPMMMERSIQAQFLIPTVISLAFGVLVASFVTLLLVPALYSLGESAAARLRQMNQRVFKSNLP